MSRTPANQTGRSGTAPAAGAVTAGIDVGSSTIKTAILRVHAPAQRDSGADVLALLAERVRRRDPRLVIERCWQLALAHAGLAPGRVAYVASTGEGELVEFRRGHFYGMTAHARGALFLLPRARAVLDVGALHARAILVDERAKVLGYRMTSQCASGSGQFIENIARYLGVALEDVGELSLGGDAPESVSSICAVLAETDVINMVSRGIEMRNILRGIHQSMAGRFARLLVAARAQGAVALTGGLALNVGLVAALRDEIAKQLPGASVDVHPDAPFAGAIGAALWGAFRLHRLAERQARARLSTA
jgi:benzoyl-CoA reductase subunit D